MFKRKEKQQEDFDNPYSRDKDQSRFIVLSWVLAAGTMLGLFVLEFVHPEETALFFSSEIVHIALNGIVLFWGTLAGYVFGQKKGQMETLLKMAGQNGGGNGKPMNNKEEVK